MDFVLVLRSWTKLFVCSQALEIQEFEMCIICSAKVGISLVVCKSRWENTDDFYLLIMRVVRMNFYVYVEDVMTSKRWL